MNKHIAAYIAIVLIFIVSVSALAAINPTLNANASHPFYVGVTYCGDSVAEAKQLIDQVKNYTNLFVLQSGSLIYNVDAIEAIGDYAVQSGLNYIVYVGGGFIANTLSDIGPKRWGSSFLGLYFLDEPGGKMIDKASVPFGSALRFSDGSVLITLYSNSSNSCYVTFYPSGKIEVNEAKLTSAPTTVYGIQGIAYYPSYSLITDYYPNGTIAQTITKRNESNVSLASSQSFTYQPDGTARDQNGNLVMDKGNITQFQTYQELSALNPFATYSKAADTFTESALSELNTENQSVINQTVATNQTIAKLFTSDYALYWFDYKAGYNTVFAEFVGNESRERHIALCRGAAETLGEDWGVMITWKYQQPPYLESGDELYSDLALAYSSGAKYAIVFTYPNITAYGTLKDEHFEALQKFWNTLHTNPQSLGQTFSRVAYVVPADYGFGFRSPTDSIWGQFPADNLSQKIYNDTTTLIAKYGASLNILYDGPGTKAELASYTAVYYYNQTIT